MYLSDLEYRHPFRRYLPSKFKVVRNRAKFCMFCPLNFFAGGPPKFWTGIIKFSLLLIIAKFRADRPTELGDLALK